MTAVFTTVVRLACVVGNTVASCHYNDNAVADGQY